MRHSFLVTLVASDLYDPIGIPDAETAFLYTGGTGTGTGTGIGIFL